MSELVGRVAVVTGGAGGIGAAVCSRLAQLGADVVLADIDMTDVGKSIADEIRRYGRYCLLVPVDVVFREECHRLVRETVEALGRLDVLVNCAGGPLGVYQPFESISEEDFRNVVDVNLKGTFFMSQVAAPMMRLTGGGRIVNFASELAILGTDRLVAYATSKGGVIALTRSLARVLAPTITVNAIAPGPVLTDRVMGEVWFRDDATRYREMAKVPLGRFVSPEEVADTVAFLVGPAGSPYTGQTFNVNGGIVMV